MPRRSTPSLAVYRRRRLVAATTLVVIVSLLFYVFYGMFAPLPAAAIQTTPPALTQQPATVAYPTYGSTLIHADGFGELGNFGPQAQQPIASIAKAVTALVILEAKPLHGNESGPTITFGQQDVDELVKTKAELGSYEDVAVGMTLSERDALTVMLLESANNYAWSLAVWSFGSIEQFLTAANDWCARHQLTQTHLADASGLDAATVSTPADLIVIGQLTMRDAVLASIVSTSVTTIPGLGEIKNGNKLLGTAGVNGIKTGTTDEAGACLLFSSVFKVGATQVHVVGVTLGAPDHATLRHDIASMLYSVRDNFHVVAISDSSRSLGTVTTSWGSAGELFAKTSENVVVWADTPISIDIHTDRIASTSEGSNVGKQTVVIGDKHFESELTVTPALPGPGIGWRFAHYGELF